MEKVRDPRETLQEVIGYQATPRKNFACSGDLAKWSKVASILFGVFSQNGIFRMRRTNGKEFGLPLLKYVSRILKKFPLSDKHPAELTSVSITSWIEKQLIFARDVIQPSLSRRGTEERHKQPRTVSREKLSHLCQHRRSKAIEIILNNSTFPSPPPIINDTSNVHKYYMAKCQSLPSHTLATPPWSTNIETTALVHYLSTAHFTLDEVDKVVSHLSNNKACGYDGMSHYNTRKKRNVESLEDECEAPVNTMKPIKQETLMWQNKVEVLQNKVNELEALNSELRQQVVELSAQQNDLIPKTSVAHEDTGGVDLSSDGNTSTDVESSVTEESCDDFSSSSSSEGTRQKRRANKSKKHKKNKRKDKNEYDKIKRANNVRDVIRRYKRLLKLTRRGATMTKAFRKEGVSLNAVAQLAPIAELYFADRVQFNSISFTPGKLAEFAEKCREHIVGDVKKKKKS
ncbi:hypothetical protein PO909_024944 [Leuciscus waleckii]